MLRVSLARLKHLRIACGLTAVLIGVRQRASTAILVATEACMSFSRHVLKLDGSGGCSQGTTQYADAAAIWHERRSQISLARPHAAPPLKADNHFRRSNAFVESTQLVGSSLYFNSNGFPY